MVSFILREEHRLRAFENRVLRKILGPKRDEVTGERRRHTTNIFIISTPRLCFMELVSHISYGVETVHSL